METKLRIKAMHRLEIIGRNKRETTLAAYEKDGELIPNRNYYGRTNTDEELFPKRKFVPTAEAVKESNSALFRRLLGSSSYIYVTVNLTSSDLRRVFEPKKK